MRRHSFLVVAFAALTCVLLGSRCSDDDKPAAPAAAMPAKAGTPEADVGRVDGGVDKDPMDGAMGGVDAEPPLEDPNDLPPQSGDSMQDDQTFEPQPVPESTKGL